jgi:hypothetical protein
MITLEAVTEIPTDRTLTLGLPKSIRPGPHRVVVVIEENLTSPAPGKSNERLHLNKLKLTGWPDDCTFRREEIYGDTGRINGASRERN